MNYTAAFYEAFEEEKRELRRVLPSGRDYFFTWKTIQELGEKLPPARIVSVRTQSALPPEWADGIDAIITRSTGYDHVTAYRATVGRDIPAAYLPDYAGRAVAEQAMLLWTALLRKLTLQRDSFKTFHRDRLTGRELLARRITVVGVGRIGAQIVDVAMGLKMEVKGVDIVPRPIPGLEYVTLEEGVERADILVCALPLTRETRGMLNYDLLTRLPAGAVFVNIARGEIAPSEDILRLLKENKLSGVGLDVYDFEKELSSVLRDGASVEDISDATAKASVTATLELSRRSDVLTTPHNAFNTLESVARKSLHTAENLARYLETGEFLTPVPE